MRACAHSVNSRNLSESASPEGSGLYFFPALPPRDRRVITQTSPPFGRPISLGIGLCGNCVTLLTSRYEREVCQAVAEIVGGLKAAGECRYIQALVFRR